MTLFVPQFLDAPEEHGKENGNPRSEGEHGGGNCPAPPKVSLLVDGWHFYAHTRRQMSGSGLTMNASSVGS